MNPYDIQAALKKAGSSQVEVANELAITDSVVNRVVHGTKTSRRIAAHIADKIGKPVEELWPGRYAHAKETTKFKPTRHAVAA